MKKSYVYKGQIYSSEKEVRNAIFADRRLAFMEEPENDKRAFWRALGVEYVEEKEDESLEFLKEQKLYELERAFSRWRNGGAYIYSSLGGVKIDADQRAMIDVSGLAALDKPAVFMDAENTPHQLTAEQIKILRREIVEGGNFSYQQKWDLRNQIKSAETKEELEKIELVFLPYTAKGAK